MQWSSIEWSRLLKLMLLGAVSFWLPDTLLHALRRHGFAGRDVMIVTAVSPVTLMITFLVVKWANKAAPQKRVGPALVGGVWIFGGLFMTVGASFAGGGFARPGGAHFVIMSLLLSIIPIYTFIMATYDGALGALLLVTAVAFVVWIVQQSGLLLRFSRNRQIHKTQL